MILKQLPNALEYNKDGGPIDAFNGNGGNSSPQNDYVQSSELAEVAFTGDYGDLVGKPTLGTAAAKDVPTSGNASTTQVVMGNDSRLTNSRSASDVSAWAKASTKPSYTKSEVGLGNVDNTSDATKKANFTGNISQNNTGFVTGGDIYNALNRYKYITVTDDNYTDTTLFNGIRPGDFIELYLYDLTSHTINISKCNKCFIFISSINDLFKLTYNGFKINVYGNLSTGMEGIIMYLRDYRCHILTNVSVENILRFKDSSLVRVSGGTQYFNASGPYDCVIFDNDNPINYLVINITNEQDLLILKDTLHNRIIHSFGDIQHPSDTTRCSTFNGFFPSYIIRYTNSSSWEELFVGCGFSLENDYIVKPNGNLSSLNKAFYYAYSYNSHTTNVDLTTALRSYTDLTSCFENADGFNVILDGVDLTTNTCTNMFKDAKNITISAIGCNQDTIDKINANISGSYTSTITVITTDPNA